jgi:N-acetylneuraminic acid mutarotase
LKFAKVLLFLNKAEDAMKTFLQISFYFLWFTQIGFAQRGYWTKVGDMPENRYGHTVDEINGKIYIVGGVNYEFSAYPRTALVYDRSSGEWSQIPLYNNKPRALHASCVVDGKLYVMGGFDSTRSLSTMDMFDPNTGEWVSKKAMSIDRSLPASASIDGKIYVMGGTQYIGSNPGQEFNTVEVYDINNDTWTQLADMPRNNWAQIAVAVNGKIYVLGGRTRDESVPGPGPYASVDVYDPQTNTWTTKSDMPTGRSSLSACVLEGNIYAIGGWFHSGSSIYDKVEVYNPDRDEWKTESPLPVKLAGGPTCIVLDGKIYVYGGSLTNHPLTGSSEIYECSVALSYAHDGALDRYCARPGLDTVCVTAALANPVHHAARLSAVVTDSLGAVRDSVLLFDDGLHGDGSAGDSLWGCAIRAPSDEGFFNVHVRTDDITQGTIHKIQMHLATAGPLTLDSVGVTKQASKYRLRLYMGNNGTAFTIHGAMAALTCRDPWIDSIIPTQIGLPDMAPGTTNAAKTLFYAALNSESFPGYFDVRVDVSIDGWVYWTDSMRVSIPGSPDSGVAEKNQGLPVAFALDQNYPNPFNPSTTIRYALPNRSRVILTVFNLLGEEVAHLVEEEKEVGYHEVQLDGRNLENGVYFYRLEAGDFVQNKKLVLLR